MDEVIYQEAPSGGGTGSNGIAVAGINAGASVLSSFFSKPQTTVYQEAPKPQNNNMLYAGGALVVIVIVLVVVKMKG